MGRFGDTPNDDKDNHTKGEGEETMIKIDDNCPLTKGPHDDHIPDSENDPVLTMARGTWTLPPPLTRKDFESAKNGTLEEMLRLVQSKAFKTKAAMARHFGWKAYRVDSLKYCLLREKLIATEAAFNDHFRKSPQQLAKEERSRKAAEAKAEEARQAEEIKVFVEQHPKARKLMKKAQREGYYYATLEALIEDLNS